MEYLSLFSGIGAFESAMKNLNIPFDLVGFSEIDKYAVKSYCAIHDVPESMNLGDITKIDETKLPNVDFVTYGFPCQDISLCGRQQGLFNADGTKTRSGLFFDALRIIEHTKPMVAIAENVKNLTSKKFSEQFQVVLESLENAGYNNYWKVLNSKDFGIPQNRDRVFIVSIRKDVDTGIFEFPESYPLKLRLKDLLEAEVDEKFYLSDDCMEKIVDSAEVATFAKENNADVPVRIGNIYGEQFGTGYAVNVWDMVKHGLRIRKLTPKECFRLMGFKDEDFAKAEAVNSNTQLYKQAGNAIVVDVAEELLCMLFDEGGCFYV